MVASAASAPPAFLTLKQRLITADRAQRSASRLHSAAATACTDGYAMRGVVRRQWERR